MLYPLALWIIQIALFWWKAMFLFRFIVQLFQLIYYKINDELIIWENNLHFSLRTTWKTTHYFYTYNDKLKIPAVCLLSASYLQFPHIRVISHIAYLRLISKYKTKKTGYVYYAMNTSYRIGNFIADLKQTTKNLLTLAKELSEHFCMFVYIMLHF